MQLSECVWMRRSSFVAIVLMAMLCMCTFVVPESFAAESEGAGEDSTATKTSIENVSGAAETPVALEEGDAHEASKASEAVAPVTQEGAADIPAVQQGDEAPQANAMKAKATEASAQDAVGSEPPVPAEPALAATDVTASYEDTHVNMYRLYNSNSGEHFYTSSLDEARAVSTAGWQ